MRLNFRLEAGILALMLGSGPCGWDLGLEAGNWVSRLEFGPQGWDLGLEDGIWALRLGFGSQGWVGGRRMRRRGRRNFLMCESIGH